MLGLTHPQGLLCAEGVAFIDSPQLAAVGAGSQGFIHSNLLHVQCHVHAC